ncbi:MAG: uroporphyrinogen decarboxylase family protein [Caldilineaceae bacterium]|jgi:uroporphyrinogen decarboxylase
MDKVERVRAAIAGEPVDRVPASFWFHFTPDKHHGKASVQAHLDYYRESNVDFLKVMNEHPYRANVDIASPADWRRIRPAPMSSDFYQEQLDEVKAILDEVQDDCLVLVTVFGPFRSGNNTSNGKVTDHLKADPLAVSQGLEAIAESLAEFAEALVDAGAAGIYYSAQGGEQDRFTEFEFLQYIKPQDLMVLDAVKDKGEFNLLHICKDYIRLPLYADYPGHVVNWAATKHNLSLREGRTLFKRTICGGMDDRGVMVDGSKKEIQAEVQAVISEIGTEGFILGADCTLPTDIDVSHIRAAVEATQL